MYSFITPVYFLLGIYVNEDIIAITKINKKLRL